MSDANGVLVYLFPFPVGGPTVSIVRPNKKGGPPLRSHGYCVRDRCGGHVPKAQSTGLGGLVDGADDLKCAGNESGLLTAPQSGYYPIGSCDALRAGSVRMISA